MGEMKHRMNMFRMLFIEKIPVDGCGLKVISVHTGFGYGLITQYFKIRKIMSDNGIDWNEDIEKKFIGVFVMRALKMSTSTLKKPPN